MSHPLDHSTLMTVERGLETLGDRVSDLFEKGDEVSIGQIEDVRSEVHDLDDDLVAAKRELAELRSDLTRLQESVRVLASAMKDMLDMIP